MYFAVNSSVCGIVKCLKGFVQRIQLLIPHSYLTVLNNFLKDVIQIQTYVLDAACKAAEMTFKQLFDHLTKFIKSADYRWRLCMRVKRGLIDPNDLGGYGKDQCYFEGWFIHFVFQLNW